MNAVGWLAGGSQLASDIRQMAEDLRVPVSNLVRNVLEEAFSVVESVSDDVGDLLARFLHFKKVGQRSNVTRPIEGF